MHVAGTGRRLKRAEQSGRSVRREAGPDHFCCLSWSFFAFGDLYQSRFYQRTAASRINTYTRIYLSIDKETRDREIYFKELADTVVARMLLGRSEIIRAGLRAENSQAGTDGTGLSQISFLLRETSFCC